MFCKRMLQILLLCFYAMLITACGSSAKYGVVATDWSCKLRELQILPTFPPREDIQVGDVYLRRVTDLKSARDYCDLKGRDDFLPIPVFLGTVNGIDDALDAFYAKRFDAPKTSKGKISIKDGKFDVSNYEVSEIAGDSIFKTSNKKRYRQVGFPDFLTVRVTGAELGGIIPILGVMSDFGFGYEAVESASISVPVAESYGVPAQNIIERFNTHFGEASATCPSTNADVSKKVEKLFGMSFEQLQSMAPYEYARGEEQPTTPTLLVTIVREVFATRAIDSSISFKQAFVAGLNRDRSGTSAEQSMGTSPNGEGGEAVDNKSGSQSASKSPSGSTGTPAEGARRSDLETLSKAVAEALSKRQGVPGVTMNVRSSSGHGIGLTRVFERPVVIGYREVSFKISKDQSGKCMTVDITNTPHILIQGPMKVSNSQ